MLQKKVERKNETKEVNHNMTSHGEICGKAHSHTQDLETRAKLERWGDYPREVGLPRRSTHRRLGVPYNPEASRPHTRWSRYATWTTSLRLGTEFRSRGTEDAAQSANNPSPVGTEDLESSGVQGGKPYSGSSTTS